MSDSLPLPLISDRSRPGRRGVLPPCAPAPDRSRATAALPDSARRKGDLHLPEVSELDAVRHFTRLSQRNYSIDGQMYPLGSCTMKYNPKINDRVASFAGIADLHPLQQDADAQGMLGVFWNLGEILKKVLGLPGVTLAPAAGAQGEFTGMAVIRAYHRRNSPHRDTVLIPDQAHGTNPASAVLAGFRVKEIKSGPDGRVSLANLRAAIDDRTAAIMLTNPNTCGIFESDILEIARLMHEAGALLYYDGANLNAIVGRARPGDMGFDCVHMNLHKTFSTPHGGGGPGAGPVGVVERLRPYLPISRVRARGDGTFFLDYDAPKSIGYIAPFYGNFAVLVRAYAYLRLLGRQGLRATSTAAVLNANYVQERLRPHLDAVNPGRCMHECVFSGRRLTAMGLHTLDLAKALIDRDVHPPTVYFPIHVPEAIMIEPTETESLETLDRFCDSVIECLELARRDPEALRRAPVTTPVGRLDEVAAARRMDLVAPE